MTEDQRQSFQLELQQVQKDRTVGLLLTLLLGGIGAHRFYLGQTGLGILYLLFCWTFIPLTAALIECFLIMGRVDRYNRDRAWEIAMRIKSDV